MGEIKPLLAVILSVMDAPGAGREVATASLEPEMAWEGELAEGAGLVLDGPAAIKLAELAGSGAETRLGTMGK